MMPELGMDMLDADLAALDVMPANAPAEEELPPPEKSFAEPINTMMDAEPMLDATHGTAAQLQAMPDEGVQFAA